jgi:hypothetical protein
MFPSLCGQRSLGLITMSLSLAILLVGVLHRNLLVHKVLTVHIGNGRVGGLKVGKRDETITLGQIVVIPSNLESKKIISSCSDSVSPRPDTNEH